MRPIEDEAASRDEPSILLVVPDRQLRGAIRARLAQRGHLAVGTDDLHDVIAFVRAHRVRMILVDRMALGRNGLRALELVRAHSPDVPIVLLTRSTSGWPRGPWNATVHESSTPDDIVATIEWLLPLSPWRETDAAS